MKKIYLYQLNKDLKFFLFISTFTVTVGLVFGLIFLFHTTQFDKNVTVDRLIEKNDEIEEDFGINESNAKTTGELLMTTHNHILGFSFIFFIIGGIFYFNSIISGVWKIILITEPLVSTIVSFSSLWLVRFLGNELIYITVISATLMYTAFFVMVAVIFYELTLKTSS